MARKHLPEDIAAKWINLLRPALQLSAAAGGEKVVGQLGGSPHLPAGVRWPSWEDYGPLTFIASVDCARLPVHVLDIALPDTGTLLFFYFDAQLNAIVPSSEPDTQGARVIYVPPGTPTIETATPDVLKPYPTVPLSAHLTATEPGWQHPMMPYVFLAPGEDAESLSEHPILDDDFNEELDDLVGFTVHQLGGYANTFQGPVEEAITDALMPGVAPDDPRRVAEAARWVLLAQIDSEVEIGMNWADTGTLYWMIRPEDLTARRFDAAAFTWQCN